MTAGFEPATAPHPELREYYRSDRERRSMLGTLFDRSAGRYDAITQWLSLGTGRWHRAQALKRAGVGAGTAVLDVACGTGLVTLAAQSLVGDEGSVVGLDASFGMLGEARAQGCRQLLHGMAERLPFPDTAFDVVTMGYALRHVVDLDIVFAEYFRTLRPGGQVVLMEIARPDSPIAHALARFYMKTLVPKFAGIGDDTQSAAKLMRYYWDTIEHCVPQPVITAALARAGFAEVQVKRWFGGLVKDYTAIRPAA
jgi:demethylmenaquinone methyltransferase/2-methoxy-6-polyprenyl-1,4-benzoquinol methylase